MTRILTFAKPKKVRSTEDHNRMNSSDCGVEGTYASNMSEEDMQKWKAKVVGTRSGNPQLEIRKVAVGTNILVIVNGAMTTAPQIKTRTIGHGTTYKVTLHGNKPHQVKVSANGSMVFSQELWDELHVAVNEAREVLAILDDQAQVKDALKIIKAGTHPLDG